MTPKEVKECIADSEDEFYQPLVEMLRKMVEPEGKYSPANCVKRFRTLVLAHSFLYYRCDSSVISDGEWDRYAKSLRILQESFPDALRIDFYDAAFAGWEGISGFDLPQDDYILAEARRTHLLYTQTPLQLPPDMEAK